MNVVTVSKRVPGAHRLGDPQRQRDRIDEEESPQSKADRDRKLFEYETADVLVVEEAFSQIEARELPEHLEKALVRRLVESVELLDFLDALGIHPLPAPIAAAARRGTFAPRLAPLELRDHLLDRAARHELDDHKGDRQDPEQRGNHQEQALQYVGPHGGVYRAHKCMGPFISLCISFSTRSR